VRQAALAYVLAAIAACAGARPAHADCPEVVDLDAVGACNGISVNWDPIPSAIEYRVLRNTTNSTSGGTVVGVVTTNSFFDANPPVGLIYYFVQTRVPAIPGCFGLGNYAGPAAVWGLPPPTTSVTVTSQPCSVTVEWSAVGLGNDLSYFVYAGDSPDPSSAVRIASTTYTAVSVVESIPRYYWVRVRSLCVESSFVGGIRGAATDLPEPVSGVSASDGSVCGGIRVIWNPCQNCSRFLVYRRPQGSPANYEELGETTQTEWLDSTPAARNGNQQYFVVSGSPVCWRFPDLSQNTAGVLDTGFASPSLMLSHPSSRIVPVGSTAEFSVPASSGEGYAVHWLRDGVPLSDGPRIAGSSTRTLTINPVRTADVARYSYIVENACNQVSNEAVLAVATPCPADFNQSGLVSVQDIFDFLAAYFTGCP
jgi:hypothetical protein